MNQSQLKIANTVQETKQLSKACLEGRLRKIHQGIYTDDLSADLDTIVLKNWMTILHYLVPRGILAYKTAILLKPQPFQSKHIIFVISTYTKTIHIHGLVIKIYKGECAEFTEQVLPYLAKTDIPRSLLENLSIVRNFIYIDIKTIGIHGVERFLAKSLRLHGEANLNRIREEAKIVAQALGYHREYQKLNQMIGALLSTSHEHHLITGYAKAVARKAPYDENRIRLFDELVLFLKKCHFIKRSYDYHASSFKNLSFYESYFSNFIEGTEFIIDEAEDIIFKGLEINHRHADSHDILSHFMISNDYSEMSMTPHNPEELVEILQRRHGILLKERPEKRPGEFKTKLNKAGNTYFVSPEEILGTLTQGFERYLLLEPGLERALFMQFLISEIHPFDDGNGRMARIMMNAELVCHDHYKIIMPNVHRDNYLNGLRLASRDKIFRTYIKVMDQAQAYTSSIHWSNYGEARERIENDGANLNSDEGIPTFNRILRTLKLSDIAV